MNYFDCEQKINNLKLSKNGENKTPKKNITSPLMTISTDPLSMMKYEDALSSYLKT